MCGHDWKNVNEVKVCTKCGLTMPDGGRPFFDKKSWRTARNESEGRNMDRWAGRLPKMEYPDYAAEIERSG